MRGRRNGVGADVVSTFLVGTAVELIILYLIPDMHEWALHEYMKGKRAFHTIASLHGATRSE